MKMLSKSNWPFWVGSLLLLIIICFMLLFISEAQIPTMFTSNGIVAIISAFIGVFMTVAVTSILLEKQSEVQKELLKERSESDESKERNVKVFETRKEKYDQFIIQLWSLWDKRSIDLEEVNELLKKVTQDIILYTKPETVNKILEHLANIAEYANPEKSNRNPEALKEIQKDIFVIINALAEEINLGGKLNEEIGKKINEIEKQLLPFIRNKEYVKKIDLLVREKINGLSKCEYRPDSTSDEKNVLLWHIDHEMYLRIGDQWKNGILYISFYSDFFKNRQYEKYRLKLRGKDKDWMMPYNGLDYFNFNEFREGRYIEEDNFLRLADYLKKFCEQKHEEFGNKTIDEIIRECNDKSDTNNNQS